MSDNLTALDATFLELEQQDEGALMSIGGVMVFDPLPEGGAPTVDDAVRESRAPVGAAATVLATAVLDANRRIRLAALDRRRSFPHS